jgi:serine/threonine protein kinase/Tol biopolymer transport system component
MNECPQCGAPLPTDTSAEGICPRCLLRVALETEPGSKPTTISLSAPASQAAGERIGPYKLLRVVGEGGMGVVWLADQEQPLRRRVTIKLIKQGMDSREVITRFESERQALALMDHPNIATVFDAGSTTDGRPFFVMEYVPGLPITRYCDDRRLGNRERLELFVQVCHAVEHAHKKGIVHRDLKPSNVLVMEVEGKPLPKVIDFGIAKATNQRLTEKTLFTELGRLIGTPEYMSPEQASGDGQEVGVTTDIYSLGVLLYELLAGVLPFDPKELRKIGYDGILRIIREQEPPTPTKRISGLGDGASEIAARRQTDPASLARQLRGELEWITLKAIEKDRRRRYGSAAEFAADVTRHLTDEPVLARRPSAIYRWRKWGRKHRGAVAATAIILALMAVSTILIIQANRGQVSAAPPVLIQVTRDAGLTIEPAVSEDDNWLAYVSDRAGAGNLDLWIQPLPVGDPIRLTRHPADEHEPVFLPNGKRIVYRSEREGGGIYVISIDGGQERLLAKEGRRPRVSPDGKWIAYWVGEPMSVLDSSKIYVIPADGGEPRQVAAEFKDAAYPTWSPDGRNLLFYGISLDATTGWKGFWWVYPLAGGVPAQVDDSVLLRGIVPGWWLPSNRVIYEHSPYSGLREGTNIWEIPIQPQTFKAGEPSQLSFGSGADKSPVMTRDGRLIFSTVITQTDLWAVPVPAGTLEGKLQRLTNDNVAETSPSVSRDGRLLIFGARGMGNHEIWLRELDSNKQRRLYVSPNFTFWPHITPDGAMTFFTESAGRHQIYRMRIGFPPEKVCEDANSAQGVAPDGTRLASTVSTGSGRASYGFRIMEVSSGRELTRFEHPQHSLYDPKFAPDGRWLAFNEAVSAEKRRLFVAPLPDSQRSGPGDWIAITDATSWLDKAEWSVDGRLLYYVSSVDGYWCIWAQQLDQNTKHPLGGPVAVHHFHDNRASMRNLELSKLKLAVATDKIIFNMGELSGNVWMATREQ